PWSAPATTISPALSMRALRSRCPGWVASMARPVRNGIVSTATWEPMASSVETITWPRYGRRKPNRRRNVIPGRLSGHSPAPAQPWRSWCSSTVKVAPSSWASMYSPASTSMPTSMTPKLSSEATLPRSSKKTLTNDPFQCITCTARAHVLLPVCGGRAGPAITLRRDLRRLRLVALDAAEETALGRAHLLHRLQRLGPALLLRAALGCRLGHRGDALAGVGGELDDLAAGTEAAVRRRVGADDAGLEVDRHPADAGRDQQQVARVEGARARERHPGGADVGEAQVEPGVARQRAAEEDAGVSALADRDARRRPAHLAVLDAGHGQVHERVGGGVVEDLDGLELDLVAAAPRVGDPGQQAQLLAHLRPRGEGVQQAVIAGDEAQGVAAAVLGQDFDDRRERRKHAQRK